MDLLNEDTKSYVTFPYMHGTGSMGNTFLSQCLTCWQRFAPRFSDDSFEAAKERPKNNSSAWNATLVIQCIVEGSPISPYSQQHQTLPNRLWVSLVTIMFWLDERCIPCISPHFPYTVDRRTKCKFNSTLLNRILVRGVLLQIYMIHVHMYTYICMYVSKI